MKARYFDTHFAQATSSLEFDPAWANGTGYFDHAVKMVSLEPGEMASSVDPQGRKIILIGTRFGTCVFFERYARKDTDDQIRVTSNVPSALRMLITDGVLGYDEFARLASAGSNIGHAVERMFAEVEKTAKMSKIAKLQAEAHQNTKMTAEKQNAMYGGGVHTAAQQEAAMKETKYHLDRPDLGGFLPTHKLN